MMPHPPRTSGSRRLQCQLTGPPSSDHGGPTGHWKIGTGSEAGYRVREKFINQPSPTEAVARTSAISGGLLVESQGGQLVVRQVSLSADLTKLHSVDTYATYQAYQRDFFVSGIYLQTGQYPTATFKADRIIPPANATSATTPVAMLGHGRLIIHGVGHDVDGERRPDRAGWIDRTGAARLRDRGSPDWLHASRASCRNRVSSLPDPRLTERARPRRGPSARLRGR